MTFTRDPETPYLPMPPSDRHNPQGPRLPVTERNDHDKPPLGHPTDKQHGETTTGVLWKSRDVGDIHLEHRPAMNVDDGMHMC